MCAPVRPSFAQTDSAMTSLGSNTDGTPTDTTGATAETSPDPAPETATATAGSTLISQQPAGEVSESANWSVVLLILLIGTLILLLAMGMAMLWVMRRAVETEVTKNVTKNVLGQLNEIENLEGKIQAATRRIDGILAEADNHADELVERSTSFQRDLTTQRNSLTKLLADITNLKAKTVKDWQTELDNARHSLGSSQTDFLQEIESLKQSTIQQLQTLQVDTRRQQQSVFQGLDSAQATLDNHLSGLKATADHRQGIFLDELDRKESIFSDEIGTLQTETIEQRDRWLENLAGLEKDIGPQLEDLRKSMKTQLEQQRDGIIEEMQQDRTAFAQQVNDLQVNALGHKELALNTIERSVTDLQQEFHQMRNDIEGRKADMMQQLDGIIEEMQQDRTAFAQQVNDLQVN
ncbi:MAG: hypothetical protein KTR27_17595, partial [Leptolyngbyaceae cyanobacterium MAG.088]|nr:hypothetical protein [Leptolyngbyaceae cyanobacterium MAG.088]